MTVKSTLCATWDPSPQTTFPKFQKIYPLSDLARLSDLDFGGATWISAERPRNHRKSQIFAKSEIS